MLKKLFILTMCALVLIFTGCNNEVEQKESNEIVENLDSLMKHKAQAEDVLDTIVPSEEQSTGSSETDINQSTFTIEPKALHKENLYESYSYKNTENTVHGDISLEGDSSEIKSISVGGKTTELDTIYEIIEKALANPVFSLDEKSAADIFEKIKKQPQDVTLAETVESTTYTYVWGDGICLFIVSTINNTSSQQSSST